MIPLAVLVPRAASADCGAVNGLVPKVLTPDKAPLVGGGGILIADVPAPYTTGGKTPPAPTFTMRDGTTKDTKIAPGLTVRVPVGKAKSNEFELVDAKTKADVVTVYASEDLGAPVAVPDVQYAYGTIATSYRESANIFFNKVVPEGVVAVVITDAKGTPRESMVVAKGMKAAAPIHGHCQQDPDGTLTTQLGDTIRLFFVDDHGRVGKPSKPIKVTATPPAPATKPAP